MPDNKSKWEQVLAQQIGLLGHRNWIVVADAAYPQQSNPGISTIISDKDHVDTIKVVKGMIDGQKHIRPIIYLDKEIDYLDNEDAPGADDFRNFLSKSMDPNAFQKLLHEDIIGMLDDASKLFNVVIIKTDFTIPYTTVFFQLDCAYWSEEKEKKLRKSMN